LAGRGRSEKSGESMRRTSDMGSIMEADAFCRTLFDFLVDFDASIPPLGLYACDDLPTNERRKSRHQEWHRGLRPRLTQIGCSVRDDFYDQEATLAVPGVGYTKLKLARISKIKVRKYGSHYRLDRLENYGERWESLKLGKELSNLWKPSSLADRSVKMRVVLFLGFDKVEDPFGKELSELEQTVSWGNRDVIYETRSLRDRYDRNFSMRMSAWARIA
jgi:hypothetical protein